MTLPPPEDEGILPPQVAMIGQGEDAEDEREDLQDRLGRRHLAAIKRERRKNFYIFLVSAAVAAAFLYWGESDGGTDPQAWDQVEEVGQQIAAFEASVSALLRHAYVRSKARERIGKTT